MPDSKDCHAYHLLFHLVQAVAQHPEKVEVKTVWVDGGAIFTIHADTEDVARLTEKEGRMVESIRNVMEGVGSKLKRQFHVLVEEGQPRAEQPPTPGVRR